MHGQCRHAREPEQQRRATRANAPPSDSKRYQLRLRAGVPQAVIAEIGAGGRIVGTIALRAVAGVAADRAGNNRNRTVIGVAVVVVGVVVARPVIIVRSAVVGVGVGSEHAADHGTCDRARKEAASTMVKVATAVPGTAAIPGAPTTVPRTTAANARSGRKTLN